MSAVVVPAPGSIATVVFRLLLAVAAWGAVSCDASAQAGAVYRCGGNDYTNALSEEQAASRGCVKLVSTEWVFVGSDGAGRQYTYNDRRTVVHDEGTIETWLQATPPTRLADAEAGAPSSSPYVRAVSPQVIRCRERTISSGATYYFDPRDSSISKDGSMRNAMFPPPEAVASTLIRQLCSARTAALDRAQASREEASDRRSARTAVALRSF